MKRGIFFVALPLIFLVTVGASYNNFTFGGAYANNAQTSTCSSISCPQYPTNNPCSTATNCQLGNNVQFLSQASPFTKLLTGDIIGFFSCFFTTPVCGQQVTQSQFNAVAQNTTNGDPFGGNVTKNAGTSDQNLCPAYNTIDNSYDKRHYATSYVASNVVQWECSGGTFPNVNLTSPTSPQLYFSCLYWNGTISNAISNPHGAYHTECSVFANGGNSFQANCWIFGNSTDITSMICDQFLNGIGVAQNWYNTASNALCLSGAAFGLCALTAYNSNNNGNGLIQFFAFFGGLLLFIMSFGIGGSADIVASGFSFIPNGQGTRFAQALGLGLMAWIGLYSEFSGWITSANLGFGIDAIVAFLLNAMFFFGIYDTTVTGANAQ